MARHFIFSLSLSLLLLSSSHAMSLELHTTYLDLRAQMYHRQYEQVLESLAQKLKKNIEDVDIGKSPVKFGQAFPFVSSISGSLITELSFFQTVDKETGKGCLSVNGLTDDYEPVVVSLEFVWEEKRWKISHSKIDFIANYDLFYKEADCSK